jgi:hypothetical protein
MALKKSLQPVLDEGRFTLTVKSETAEYVHLGKIG